MNSNKLRLSVIIPTFGREAEPISVVKGLLRQTRMPNEIVVIDQNFPRFNRLDKFLESCGDIVRHYYFDDPGVCINYNRGIQKATGDILLFLDDDVEIQDNLIEAHLKNYINLDEIGGVAGGVLQPKGDKAPFKIKYVGRYFKNTGKVIANFNYDKKCFVDFAPGGNMSYQKKILDKISGCDLAFEGNGYFFEPDLGLRVKALKYKIVFEPDAMVKHLMAPRGGTRIDDKAIHTYYFVKNGLLLIWKHSNYFVLLISKLKAFLYILLKSIYNLNIKIFFLGCKAILGARVY